MILESISIKPNTISNFLTFGNYLEVKVKGQAHFMGLIRLKKASNVARDRISLNQNNIYLTPSGLTWRVHPSRISATYGLAWRAK